MADNAAGEKQHTIQQSTIDGSFGGKVTLTEAAAMVTVEVRVRAQQWQQWRQ
jgi:hypothetical protein